MLKNKTIKILIVTVISFFFLFTLSFMTACGKAIPTEGVQPVAEVIEEEIREEETKEKVEEIPEEAPEEEEPEEEVEEPEEEIVIEEEEIIYEIVFSSDHDGTPYSIYSCMPDGSDFKRIYSDGFRDANLCWNKDHSQLVTASTIDGDDDNDLFIIDLANGDISRLTDREGQDLEPNISPDGNLVVFAGTVGSDNTEIFTVGISIKQLTNDPYWNSYPHYSPDGKTVIFSSDRSGYSKLYTMDTEGNNIIQLTNSGEWHDWDGSFSPDGKKIVFVSDRSGNDEIWVMPLDNPEAAINLTNNPDVDMYPDYSPDGDMIVFESDRDEAVEYMHDIFVMDADGDNQTNITPDLKGSYQVGPSW